MPVLNWCYGAYQPLEFEEVEKQFRAAHRYRNRLCALELERRKAVEDALQEMSSDYTEATRNVEEIEEAIETIYAAIRLRAQKERKPPKARKEEQEQLQDFRGMLKELRIIRKKVKQEAFTREDVKAIVKEATDTHRAAVRAARKSSDVYWGTYLTVEAACKDFGKGPPPRFVRWQGEGTISIQLQGGLSVEGLLSLEDTRLRLLHVKDDEYLVKMRIGSNPDKSPIFAAIPIVLHRPLPTNGIIKWAYLERRMCASDAQWTLRFTIEVGHANRPQRMPTKPLVAVHVGWRKTPAGALRVAKWCSSDGEMGELVLSLYEMNAFAFPERLRSIRDKNLDVALAEMRSWLAANKRKLSDWMKEQTATIGKWKSPARLATLVVYWRQNRFAGDETIFETMEQWRKQDKHLWLWECHQRRKWRVRRNYRYRCFSKILAQRFERISLMQADWAELRKKPTVDKEEKQTPAMRRAGAAAAVATLETYLTEAFGADCVLPSDIKGITQQCFYCGAVNKDIGANRTVQCVGCKRRWDVDENGVRNQLVRATKILQEEPVFESIMQQRLECNGHQLSKRQQRLRKKVGE